MSAYLREKKQLLYPVQPLRGIPEASLLATAAVVQLAWTGLAFYGLYALIKRKK